MRNKLRQIDKTVDRVGYWRAPLQWLWGWLGGSVIVGALGAFWESISQHGWAAVALFGLAGGCLIILVLAVAAELGTSAYRRIRPTQTQSVDDDSAIYSSNPEKESGDPLLYNQLVAFAIDYLLPACDALFEFQSKAMQAACLTPKAQGLMVWGMRYDYHHKARPFLEHHGRISAGLTESPGPTIRLSSLIDAIFELEQSAYREYCEYAGDIVSDQFFKNRNNDDLKLLWEGWRTAHANLISNYEQIKRDSRMEKLFRPARSHRWGRDRSAPLP